MSAGRAPTGFVTAGVLLEHEPGPGNEERPARLLRILERLEESPLRDELARAEATAADPAWVERVHAPEHRAYVEGAFAAGVGRLDWDTPLSARSYEAALTAVGAALEAADRVARREWRNAFCAVRPPGHHAEAAQSMGFCLFNNVAIAARYLQEAHGLERVAILDWDVHHGNGTQHIFEEDASVFYASIHQYPHYPGTGAATERGVGGGLGTTLNCPVPAGAGDEEYCALFDGSLLPALDAFAPDALLLSAGFDPHVRDPLSGTRVTTEAFGALTRRVVELAERRCEGRLVSLLEGGYDLDALGASVLAHLAELRRG